MEPNLSTPDKDRERSTTDQAEGVFPYLINNAGFIDRVDCSSRGRRRKRLRGPITPVCNLAIGGPGRLYARSMHFVFDLGANRGEFRYGLRLRYPWAPESRIMLRAVGTPVTAAELCITEDSLLWKHHYTYFSAVELTFDISNSSLCSVAQQFVLGRRKLKRFVDRKGNATFYLGSANSPWQVRAYQKAENIVRLEFILRLRFLRAHGIRRAPDLLKLRRVPLLNRILPPCPLRRLLRKMQRALIW